MPSPRKTEKPNTKSRHDTVNPNLRTSLRVAARHYAIEQHKNEQDAEHDIVFIACTPPLKLIDLTVMTTAEVEALRKFFNDAFDRAQVITRQLDEIAQRETAAGNGVYKRLYRPDPVRFDFAN